MDTMLEQVGALMARVHPVSKTLDRVVSYIAPQRAAAACSGTLCGRACVQAGWWCKAQGYQTKTVYSYNLVPSCTSSSWCYTERCGC